MKINRQHLPTDIWALGLVSLFMDTSSELVHGLLPVFLVTSLGASLTTLGILEGLAEATTLVLKVFSGTISDWLGKRKLLIVIGYAMGALSKPVFAVANSISVVFGARLFDRVGKGIRGAPRDALVADLVPSELRGRAFGLRQSLDTVGAFLGPILAIFLMHAFENNFRTVFWIATVPGLLAVCILLFAVHEKKGEVETIVKRAIRFKDVGQFRPAFWFVVVVGSVFQLARFSEAFLILRAKDFGLGLAFSPVVLIVMNLVYALSAYPVGFLSDKMNREWFLALGLFLLCLADAILALGGNLVFILIGISLWGLHLGLTQGTLAALVADTCPSTLRGTAYGIFNFFSAGALLLASIVAGSLWDHAGAKFTFLTGGAFAFLSLILLLMTRSYWGSKDLSNPNQ